ncbi:Lactate utilization protein C [Ureibacillus acetophenoni]
MKGTVHNREEFLDQLAKSLGRERRINNVTLPTWKHRVNWEVMKDKSKSELISTFKEQCNNIHTAVIETTKEDLSAILKQVVLENGGGPIFTSNDKRFTDYKLDHLLDKQWPKENIEVNKWDYTIDRELNHSILEKANIALVFSDYSLAESGTVVVETHKGQGRALHFLPNNYLVIIPENTIVPRMIQAVHDINKRIEDGELVPSCINFISGPSNSADIEMNLVVGVHGPLKAFYVIVKDN